MNRPVGDHGPCVMKARGLELIAADKPDSFRDDTPTAVLSSGSETGQAVSRLPRCLPRKNADPDHALTGSAWTRLRPTS